MTIPKVQGPLSPNRACSLVSARFVRNTTGRVIPDLANRVFLILLLISSRLGSEAEAVLEDLDFDDNKSTCRSKRHQVRLFEVQKVLKFFCRKPSRTSYLFVDLNLLNLLIST
jgi:hypothetical protein